MHTVKLCHLIKSSRSSEKILSKAKKLKLRKKKILSLVKPGVRECDIAAEISYWHRKYGAESDAFDPIVAGSFYVYERTGISGLQTTLSASVVHGQR